MAARTGTEGLPSNDFSLGHLDSLLVTPVLLTVSFGYAASGNLPCARMANRLRQEITALNRHPQNEGTGMDKGTLMDAVTAMALELSRFPQRVDRSLASGLERYGIRNLGEEHPRGSDSDTAILGWMLYASWQYKRMYDIAEALETGYEITHTLMRFSLATKINRAIERAYEGKIDAFFKELGEKGLSPAKLIFADALEDYFMGQEARQDQSATPPLPAGQTATPRLL